MCVCVCIIIMLYSYIDKHINIIYNINIAYISSTYLNINLKVLFLEFITFDFVFFFKNCNTRIVFKCVIRISVKSDLNAMLQ